MSDGAPSRFARRQWRRRLRALRPYAVGLLVVGLVGFAVWAVFFSTWLAVDDVEVDGAELLSADEVVSTADIQLVRSPRRWLEWTRRETRGSPRGSRRYIGS